MDYIVDRQRIDKEKKEITYYLKDKTGQFTVMSIADLKKKIQSGEINLVNFKLEGGKLKYTNGFFNYQRETPDSILSEDKYIVDYNNSKYILYDRNGNSAHINRGDFEYLGRAGRLINTQVIDNVEFTKLKEETGLLGEPVIHADSSVKVTRGNFDKIDRIIQISYENYVKIRDKFDRKCTDDYMEPRKFWSIIRSFNQGKMDYTANNIEVYGKQIADKFFLYQWFNMTDEEFSKFDNSLRDFEGTVYSHDCMTKGRQRYFDAVPGSDDGFRQAMCTFLWLYGEQGCKEFIQDPSGTIEKYKIPVDALSRCYIFGY